MVTAKNNNHTAKPLLWLGIASIIMIFAGLTSAYLVRQADPHEWLVFELPRIFWGSTAVLLLSSCTVFGAVRQAKKNQPGVVKWLLFVSLSLGALFCVFQIIGWGVLQEQSIILSGSPSASFLYVISGLHLAHILAGLIVLTVIFIQSLHEKYNSSNILGLQLGAIFWHFLDGLWIYLFIFFLLFR